MRSEAQEAELEPEPDDDFECEVTYTALGKGDNYEASCPCGFWTKGSKAHCRQMANGHPPRRVP